jgi:hypothetical protein
VTDRLSELEAKVAALAGSLEGIERRLDALERTRGAPAAAPRRSPASRDATAAQARTDLAAASSVVTFVGRTLLVLAGAFVLRALTDGGKLAAPLGVGLGLAYAGTWVALADRAGRAGGKASAAFHGASAVLIGFPLLYEATTRFALLSPYASAALLAVLTGVALGVAGRRQLVALAWLVALAGMPTAVALASASGRVAPFAIYLVLLGVAALWLGYVRDWHALRWPTAAVADLAVAAVAFRAVAPGAAEGPGTALAVQVALLALYLGSIAARTLVLGRGVVPFEAVQTPAAIAVGLGGAALVALRTGTGAGGFGAAGILFGVASYAVAFAFVERRQQSRANFVFYTSVAIVFVIVGVELLLSGLARDLVWAVLALAAALAWRRTRRRTLAVHGAAYAITAAIATGLLRHAAEAIGASPAAPWTPAGAGPVLVLLGAAATAWLTADPAWRPTLGERLPRLLLVCAVAAGAAGVIVGWLAPAVAGVPGAGADPGAIATVRTAVLVAGAMALAWAGRHPAWLEAGWLAYAVLAGTGLKILLEDLPRGRPATYIVAFGLYGAALLLFPRMRRSRAAQEPEPGR